MVEREPQPESSLESPRGGQDPPGQDGARWPLICVGVCSPLVLLALVLGGPWAERAFAPLAVLFPVGLIGVGLRRSRRRAAVRTVLVALGLVLAGSALGILAWSGRASGGIWTLYLPPATALMLVGLGIVPLLIVSIGHAWSFERRGSGNGER